MSKLRKLTRTWLRWAADMEDKHGQPIAAGLAADMGFVEQEKVMNDPWPEIRTIWNKSPNLERLLTDADSLLALGRDVIAKCEDPQYRTRMTQQQQIEFLEMLRNSVLAALPEHLRAGERR